jgi:hypothetical protein
MEEGDRLGAGIGRFPVIGDLARGRAIGALPEVLGAFTGALGALGAVRGLGPLGRMGRIGRGRPGLGFLVQPTGGPSLLHLGLGVHTGTNEADLADIAELGPVDAVLLDLARASVDAVVRAVRLLEPTFVLLYRSEDAYQRGRRRSADPVSAFAEAVAEDRGDEVEVHHLRRGDRFVFGPDAAAPREGVAQPAAR